MDGIKYIHAADLHLDAPFRGLGRETAIGNNLGRMLREATFTALNRLVSLCETEKPDFLLLAGDIYNQEEKGIKAQIALRDACARLGESGINVFIAHGNHDPLSSRLESVKWPDNVTIFGQEVEKRVLQKNEMPLAVIHGISHSRDRESRNLAQLFKRDPEYDVFQIGVLHCSLDGSLDRYAPCSLEDLRASGLDAWALGHAHERAILLDDPFIAYSGNTQGLHVNEPGPRGCYVVCAERRGNGWHCKADFHQLGPIRWEKIAINLAGVETPAELDTCLNNDIEDYRSGIDAGTTGVIARLRLEGNTRLNGALRQSPTQEELAERLQHFAGARPAIWLKDCEIATIEPTPPEDNLTRDDLLGETARVAKNILADAGQFREFTEKALRSLVGNARFRKALQAFDDDGVREMLMDAERICQDVLEGR